jgi:hypothetical protein
MGPGGIVAGVAVLAIAGRKLRLFGVAVVGDEALRTRVVSLNFGRLVSNPICYWERDTSAFEPGIVIGECAPK